MLDAYQLRFVIYVSYTLKINWYKYVVKTLFSFAANLDAEKEKADTILLNLVARYLEWKKKLL